MKKISALFLGLSLLAAGCSDDEGSNVQLSDEETANLIGLTISGDGGSLSGHFTDVLYLSENIKENPGGRSADFCDYSDEYSATYESEPGDQLNISMTQNWEFTTTCNENNTLDAIAYTLSFAYIMSMDDMTINTTYDADMSVTGLAGTSYEFNGEIAFDLDLDQAGNSEANGTHKFFYQINDVVYSETKGYPVSGSAVVEGRGSVASGSYAYTAQIVYNSNGTITVTVNKSVFIIDSTTGQIVG